MRLPVFVLLTIVLPAGAGALDYRNGDPLPGQAIAFDYERKILTVEEPLTGETTEVPEADLSLRSRQIFLLSPVFHRSYPEEWPREKLVLLAWGVLSPVAALLAGFWISGLLLTGKVNPLRAVIGFFGSWIVGALFVTFYLFFSGRLGGGNATVAIGGVFALVFVPMFVSAIYACSFLKGFGIFAFHLVAGFSLFAIALIGLELLVAPETLEDWWNTNIFVPVGLSRNPLSS